MSQHYQVTGPHIVHETIEDEVVIVNMETGAYYSLQGSGHAIWTFAVSGQDATKISSNFLEAEVDGKPIVQHVEDFLTTLTDESLLTSADSAPGPDSGESTDSGAATTVTTPTQFVTPALEKFTDMEEFLLVDPIHEVGEKGWPQRPT